VVVARVSSLLKIKKEGNYSFSSAGFPVEGFELMGILLAIVSPFLLSLVAHPGVDFSTSRNSQKNFLPEGELPSTISKSGEHERKSLRRERKEFFLLKSFSPSRSLLFYLL